jgi:hypothetical protein
MASSAADVAANNSSSNNDASQTEEPNFTHVPWPIRPSPGINYDFVSTLYFIGCMLALSFYILETQILAPLLLSSKSDDDDNVTDSTVDTTKNSHESDDSGSSEEKSSDDGNALKEFAQGMGGMYFIFLPFIPCFLWSLVVRYFWLKETQKKCVAVNEKKKEN